VLYDNLVAEAVPIVAYMVGSTERVQAISRIKITDPRIECG
jgi:hypothetical protein